MDRVPIERGLNLNVDVLYGPEAIEPALTDWRYASLDYFDTMRIPIVAGRAFSAGDRVGASPVAVVSEQFAKKFLTGVNPVGHHIRVFRGRSQFAVRGPVHHFGSSTPTGDPWHQSTYRYPIKRLAHCGGLSSIDAHPSGPLQ